MIFESSYWKDDLLKIAERMKRRQVQKRWTERSLANLEKDVFIAFYSIRKLFEARKLSINVTDSPVNLTSYKAISEVTRLNKHKIDEKFDLSNGSDEKQKLIFLCNQLIHSYIFEIGVEEETNGLSSIFFCSDRERNRKLYQLELSELLRILESVGTDYPTAYMWTYEDNEKDYRVVSYSGSEDEFLK